MEHPHTLDPEYTISAYDHAVATRAAWLSWAAYEGNARHLPHKAIVVDRKNARVVVNDLPDCVEVAFAGSDDWWDWWGNFLRFRSQRTHVGPIYHGIARYYDLLRRDLSDVLKSLSVQDGKPVRATGHSLGGGTAEQFAVRLRKNGGNVLSVDTFGAPMVGADEFAAASEYAGIPTRNWWMPGDMVPYQPLLFGVRSLGYRRLRPPMVPRGIRISRSVPPPIPAFSRFLRRSIAHSMQGSYIPGIAAILPVG